MSAWPVGFSGEVTVDTAEVDGIVLGAVCVLLLCAGLVVACTLSAPSKGSIF